MANVILMIPLMFACLSSLQFLWALWNIDVIQKQNKQFLVFLSWKMFGSHTFYCIGFLMSRSFCSFPVMVVTGKLANSVFEFITALKAGTPLNKVTSKTRRRCYLKTPLWVRCYNHTLNEPTVDSDIGWKLILNVYLVLFREFTCSYKLLNISHIHPLNALHKILLLLF